MDQCYAQPFICWRYGANKLKRLGVILITVGKTINTVKHIKTWATFSFLKYKPSHNCEITIQNSTSLFEMSVNAEFFSSYFPAALIPWTILLKNVLISHCDMGCRRPAGNALVCILFNSFNLVACTSTSKPVHIDYRWFDV